MITRPFVALLCLLLVSACSDDGSNLGLGASTRLTHISVEGQVISPNGAPVPSAAITINVGESKAGENCSGILSEQAVTASDGRFAKVVQSGPLNIVACVLVTATPESGSGLAAKTVRAADVQFQSAALPPPVTTVLVQLEASQ